MRQQLESGALGGSEASSGAASSGRAASPVPPLHMHPPPVPPPGAHARLGGFGEAALALAGGVQVVAGLFRRSSAHSARNSARNSVHLSTRDSSRDSITEGDNELCAANLGQELSTTTRPNVPGVVDRTTDPDAPPQMGALDRARGLAKQVSRPRVRSVTKVEATNLLSDDGAFAETPLPDAVRDADDLEASSKFSGNLGVLSSNSTADNMDAMALNSQTTRATLGV